MTKHPPKDISPQELWSKMIELPRPTKVIDFPRKNENGEFFLKLKLKIMTLEDYSRINCNVKSKISNIKNESKKIKNILEKLLYFNELLFECSMDCNNNHFFPNADVIPKIITEEEFCFIYFQFIELQEKFNPIHLNQEQADIWSEKIIEGGKYSNKFYIIGSCENIKDVFGIPAVDLTEGQILVWAAARKFFKSLT